MTDETRRLFRSLVWEDRNFLEFFTADYAYLTQDLAKLYGMPTPNEPGPVWISAPHRCVPASLGRRHFLR